jgi:hypothetical protein
MPATGRCVPVGREPYAVSPIDGEQSGTSADRLAITGYVAQYPAAPEDKSGIFGMYLASVGGRLLGA